MFRISLHSITDGKLLFYDYLMFWWSRGSSVRIEGRLQAGWLGFNSRQGQ
jgi:hypothetical protein